MSHSDDRRADDHRDDDRRDDSHVDDEQLALRALGEPLSTAAVDHLRDCARCAAEFDQYSAVVSTARSLTSDDAPLTPGPQVWTNITNELGLGTTSRSESEMTTEAPGEPAPADTNTAPGEERVVVSLDDRRRRWPTGLLVAAASAGVIAGGVLALGGSALVDDEPTTPIATPTPDVVASTTLVALPEHEGSGDAKIVQTADGAELVIDVRELSSGDGFHEVWLIDPKTFEMVGLGALNSNAGRFPIPDGLDLSKYSVVDISIEPFDGDPVHSTDSVVRGQISV